MVSSIGVIEDVNTCVTLDLKTPGDLIYVIGDTKPELGGSEYFHMFNETGKTVPQVDPEASLDRYRRFYKATQKNLIASAISVALGGLGAALAKMAIGGKLGLTVNLTKIPATDVDRNDYLLFSESQSRFVVTIDPTKKEEFEKLFPDAAQIGIVTSASKPSDNRFTLTGLTGNTIVDLTIDKLESSYKKTFKDY